MGIKIHCESYMPVYHSMRDLNEDSNSSSWPVCYGDNSITSGQYYNGYTHRDTTDSCLGYNKDVLKQKMLEHEAVFKDQVFELHRLYRVQRNIMEEVRRKEIHRFQESIEPSSSSSHQGCQVPLENAQKWQIAGFPLSDSACGKTSVSRVELSSTPMSCTKANGKHPCQMPYQNGSVSKYSEALDLRPSKVRKRLFDLQLPADDCISADELEKLQEIKASDVSGCAVNADLRIDSGNFNKLTLRGHVSSEPDCQIVASSSAFCLRNSTGLADLNEPILTDEADFLGHSLSQAETKSILTDRINVSHIGGHGKAKHAGNGLFINSIASRAANESVPVGTNEARSTKGNLNSLTHGVWQDKLPIPFHPVQGMVNPTNHTGSYAASYGREDRWRVGNHSAYDRSWDCANNSHIDSLMAPQARTSYPFIDSSSLTGSWVQPVVPWGKPSSSFDRKVTKLEPSSGQNEVVLGGSWRRDAVTMSNQVLGGELIVMNGFYHGSSSGAKDVNIHVPPGFDYPHSSWGTNAAPARAVKSEFGNFCKGLCHVDSKPVLDINLNEAVSRGSVYEGVMLQDLRLRDGKGRLEDHHSSLPWLKRKPSNADSVGNARRRTIGDLNQPCTSEVMPTPTVGEIVRKMEVVEIQNVTSNGSDGRRKKISFDMNLEYEPDEQIVGEETVEEEPKRVASVREYIDLNSCASDCEDPSTQSYQRKTDNVKPTLDIDLEAPILLDEDDGKPVEENDACAESLQNKTEELHDEVLRNAAEAMVAISSFCFGIDVENSVEQEPSLADSLLWFVDALSNGLEFASHTELTIRDCSRNDSSAEIDDFEAMTLQLCDIKQENCMCKLLIPEVQKVEAAPATTTNALSTRSRRGQSRRGRQRRDFQRDILPGLTTLSRHEVTEDIQIFGGLMKATGHHWVSGLTRRNGTKTRGARGRRRAVAETVTVATPSPVCAAPPVQHFSRTDAGLEDRSLTGWGKMTRRPRRQRYPAGNPPTAGLT